MEQTGAQLVSMAPRRLHQELRAQDEEEEEEDVMFLIVCLFCFVLFIVLVPTLALVQRYENAYVEMHFKSVIYYYYYLW